MPLTHNKDTTHSVYMAFTRRQVIISVFLNVYKYFEELGVGCVCISEGILFQTLTPLYLMQFCERYDE